MMIDATIVRAHQHSAGARKKTARKPSAAVVTLPYALDRKMLFFGAFTGAGLLRNDPPDRYVFNYRASYAEETAAVVNYLVKVRRSRLPSLPSRTLTGTRALPAWTRQSVHCEEATRPQFCG